MGFPLGCYYGVEAFGVSIGLGYAKFTKSKIALRAAANEKHMDKRGV